MEPPLYLDTARIGLMTTEARQACDDALVLAEHDPSSTFREFSSEKQSSSIRHWSGLGGLRENVLQRIDCPTHHRLLTATNSASLLALAARCIFSLARKPLVTDLAWPNHFERLEIEQRLTRNQLCVAAIRNRILTGKRVQDIVDHVAWQYEANDCDAVFLTAISSDGIRLPIKQILSALHDIKPPRFVVVDGAQEFAHSNKCSASMSVDLYLFGSHKWLGAYHPLSLGSYGSGESKGLIETTLSRMIRWRELNDTALRYTYFDEEATYETVNLLPYFALAGALATDRQKESGVGQKLNMDSFVEIAAGNGWQDRNEKTGDEFKSGIIVIEKNDRAAGSMVSLESRLLRNGLAMSSVSTRAVRASMPHYQLSQEDKSRINDALCSV